MGIIILGMPSRLMDVFSLLSCAHKFSWPRRGDSGEYYQVCLMCGTEYGYDWNAMRRTAPRQTAEPSSRRKNEAAPRGGRPRAHCTWQPRERRLRHHVPLRYRLQGSTPWLEGTMENVSRSGVLFSSNAALDRGTVIELVFEMPEEIAGQRGCRALCRGLVTRSIGFDGDAATIAASISDCHLLNTPN
jgi:hypothetical protein